MNELHEPTPDEIGAINELLGSLTTEDRVRVDPSPGLWDRITAVCGYCGNCSFESGRRGHPGG